MAQQSQLTDDAIWTKGEEYGGEWKARSRYFKKAFNELALLEHASSIRGGIQCRLHDKFSVGSFYFVTKITFDDGVDWIARLRMPVIEKFDENGPIDGTSLSRDREDHGRILYEMRSELDTMEFVRLNSNIPIPMVYASNLDDDNAVGFPYSLMQYVHGSTASKLAAKTPRSHEGIPEQYAEKFFRQVARIMHQLANIRMPKIGSVVRSTTNSSEFEVGPLVETNSGPYKNKVDFYSDYPPALARKEYGSRWEDGAHGQLVKSFHDVAKEFLHHYRPPANQFGMANYDLNPSNIIVDQDFNILAVIDWDMAFFVPDAVLHRFPFLMGLSCNAPSIIEEHPACKTREQLARRFAMVVEEASSKMAKEARETTHRVRCEDLFVFTRKGFYSKEAVAFRALIHFKMHQDWVNEKWVTGLE